MQMKRTYLLVASLCFLVSTSVPLLAQPLVTGNLTLYYDFDEIVTNADGVKQFLDESGNNLPGTIFEGDDLDADPGTLTVDPNSVRGAGAANFRQSTVDGDLPVYMDVDGQNITTNFPELLPTSGLNDLYGLSIAAWLNISEEAVGDQSVFQARTSDGGHGAPHFQLQGDGRLRMTFRDQLSGNVVNQQVFTDGALDSGEPYPREEWFHYAGTYDVDEGVWAIYFDGELIDTDEVAGLDLGDWGGFEEDFFAAGVGAVYDSGGRRLNGMMDELYVFNRALTAEEVLTLATPPVMSLPGDCNGDGVVNAMDLSCVATVEDRDVVLGALNTVAGDLDGNGDVAFPDFLILSANFGGEGLSYAEGNIDLVDTVGFPDFLVLSANFGNTAGSLSSVPEPSGAGLLLLGSLALLRRRDNTLRI